MFLDALTRFIGYRFRDSLRPHFKVPNVAPQNICVNEIKEKARASSAVAGIFLAFTATFLVALISTQELGVVLKALGSDKCALLLAFLGAMFPYLILREERRISGAMAEAHESFPAQQSPCDNQSETQTARENDESRRRREHYTHLAIWSVVPLLTFVPVFLCSPGDRLSKVLSLSGFFLIVLSMLLLVLAVEFYDTAASWQARDDKPYHFHMASIASHCYLMGFSVGLVGVSLLFCLSYPRTGYIIAAAVLIVLIGMTEIERELFRLHR